MRYIFRYGKFITFLIGIFFFFFSSGLLGQRNLKKYRNLAENGMKSEIANVASKEPNNHEFVRYNYQVNSVEYSGTGSSGNGNPKFVQLEVGDKVMVFYDQNSPDTSILGNPKLWLKQEEEFVFYGSLVMAIFLWAILFFSFHFWTKMLKRFHVD
jgi:hypothetical protein